MGSKWSDSYRDSTRPDIGVYFKHSQVLGQERANMSHETDSDASLMRHPVCQEYDADHSCPPLKVSLRQVSCAATRLTFPTKTLFTTGLGPNLFVAERQYCNDRLKLSS